MRYCGIDPSITSTGVVIINGKKVTVENLKFPEVAKYDYLSKAHSYFWGLFQDVDYVGLEGYSFKSKGRGGSKLMELGGIIRLIAFQNKKPTYIIAPQNLKKFVGVKKKDEMPQEVNKLWKFKHKCGDIVDAYALAQYCKALTEKTEKLTTNQKQAIASWQKNRNGINL